MKQNNTLNVQSIFKLNPTSNLQIVILLEKEDNKLFYVAYGFSERFKTNVPLLNAPAYFFKNAKQFAEYAAEACILNPLLSDFVAGYEKASNNCLLNSIDDWLKKNIIGELHLIGGIEFEDGFYLDVFCIANDGSNTITAILNHHQYNEEVIILTKKVPYLSPLFVESMTNEVLEIIKNNRIFENYMLRHKNES